MLLQQDLTPLPVDTRDLTHEHPQVPLPVEQAPKIGWATSAAFRPAVATWYSSGWKVVKLLRSIKRDLDGMAVEASGHGEAAERRPRSPRAVTPMGHLPVELVNHFTIGNGQGRHLFLERRSPDTGSGRDHIEAERPPIRRR